MLPTAFASSPADLYTLYSSMLLIFLITSKGYLDSRWMVAASFIFKPLFVAHLSPAVSFAPPAKQPPIAPHLKPSLPAATADLRASFMFPPVSIAFVAPAVSALIAPMERAASVPVLAATANIMLTAGADGAASAETVMQTRITPLPIATFFTTVLKVSSSWASKALTIVCPSSPTV